MAETSWPYVDVATSDIEWSRIAREWQDNGVIGALGGTELKVTADGSGPGLKVTAAAGMGIIRGYAYRNDAPKAITLDAASVGARVDRIVLQLNVAATPPSTRVTLVKKIGTSGSPTPAALTQTDTGIFEIGVALIAVGAGVTSISAGNVTDDRDFIGSRMGQWLNDGKRPPAPRKYQLGFNETRGYLEYCTGGTSWAPVGAQVRVQDLLNPDARSFVDGGKLWKSTADPLNSQGNDGDFWAKYIP